MPLKTIDYTVFKKFPGNRPIDPLNLKKIINSLKVNDMLELRPILVNKDMEVIDGQHRLEAAKVLALPVFYTIQKNVNPVDMMLLNSCQKQWALQDYINFYASQGVEYYVSMVNFSKKHSIDVVDFLIFCGLYGGTCYKGVKQGKYEYISVEAEEEVIKKIGMINQVSKLIDEKTFGNKKYLQHRTYKRALASLLNNSALNVDIFSEKLTVNISKIHPCTTTADYFQMFRSIYNFRNTDPI